MTILPTKRSGNNNNNEDSKENSTPSQPAKERPSRHRDELNASSDSPAVPPRRQFPFSGSTGERNELQIRFKDATLDSCRDRRERDRQKHKDIRRERKRDRQITRIAKTDNIEIKETSTSADTSEAAAAAPIAEKEDSAYDEDEGDGFNSEDEYLTRKPVVGAADEDWNRQDAYFARCLMKLGFEIKIMHDDGACMFRAIADQVYGDQELHTYVRSQCMDYIVQNKDYFAPYVTEDFNKYVERKRRIDVHGNHLEIQALSEMYNRTIEVYCYHSNPINIFNASRITSYEPIRVSYHRMCHYNSITNPKKPSILVGLGLPNYRTRCDLDRGEIHDAVRQSEELLIEQTMLEDKMKATDWEATNDAMEEEIARQSYIQYYQDAERRLKDESNSSASAGSSSTITSGMCSSSRATRRGSMSPRGSSSPKGSLSPKGGSSPKNHSQGSSRVTNTVTECPSSAFEIPDIAGYNQQMSSIDIAAEPNNTMYLPGAGNANSNCDTVTENIASVPHVDESSIVTNNRDEEEYQDWEESIMAQMLAESQLTYFEDLKRKVYKQHESPGPSTSY